MSKQVNDMLKRVDQLEAIGTQAILLAKGLRKELLHFNAGARPKGKRLSSDDELTVITGLRKSIRKKVS